MHILCCNAICIKWSKCKVKGLDHIAVIVSNEESITFYEALGFNIIKRLHRKYDDVVFLQNGAVILEIFIDANHPERLQNPEAKGLRHIAFVVEDMQSIINKLAKKGFTAEEVRQDWFGRNITFIEDPDGQKIELVENGIEKGALGNE